MVRLLPCFRHQHFALIAATIWFPIMEEEVVDEVEEIEEVGESVADDPEQTMSDRRRSQ